MNHLARPQVPQCRVQDHQEDRWLTDCYLNLSNKTSRNDNLNDLENLLPWFWWRIVCVARCSFPNVLTEKSRITKQKYRWTQLSRVFYQLLAAAQNHPEWHLMDQQFSTVCLPSTDPSIFEGLTQAFRYQGCSQYGSRFPKRFKRNVFLT
jgi:hypothetical protein